MIGPEERQSANRRRARAGERGVAVEERSMIPEKTSRANAAPVSNGQPITLQISYFDLSSVR